MLLKFPRNDGLVVLIELGDMNAKLQRVLGGHKGRWGSSVIDRADAKLIFGFESNHVRSALLCRSQKDNRRPPKLKVVVC